MGKRQIKFKISKNSPLSNYDIQKALKRFSNFRGVFMRNNLPKKAWVNECGVVNLDSIHGMGTHWVAYRKQKKNIVYFDSFGNLPPPLEIIEYFQRDNKNNIFYNYNKFQKFSETNCGQLCIAFLRMRNPFRLILKNI